MMMLLDAPAGDARQAQADGIRQLHASAQARARHALELYRAGRRRNVRDRVERCAREAVGMYYELGQLIADPTLAAPAAQPPATAVEPLPKPAALPPAPVAPPPRAAPARPPARRGAPRLHGINVWCLTHPVARQELGTDSRALSALNQLWARDPDPRRTLNLHGSIVDAMDRGAVDYAVDEQGGIGYYHRCPWGPVYVAREALTLDSQGIRKGEQFILDVKAEEGEGTGLFTRYLLVGRFERMRPLYNKGMESGARYVAPRLPLNS